MREDEVTAYLKAAEKQLKKHAEVINTLNKNQQTLVKKLDEYEKSDEVNKRVQEIIKQTQASTKAAEAKGNEPAKPAEPSKEEPAKKDEPAKEPAKEPEKTPQTDTTKKKEE